MVDKEQQGAAGPTVSKVIELLEPLNDPDRQKVLVAVQGFFGFQKTAPSEPSTAPTSTHSSLSVPDDHAQLSTPITDIRALREQKQPRTDIEMVAVMAFYLQELAPDRRESVSADDVETYFKQANAKLPKNPAQTLRNAKNAGYLDALGDGRFKLNPVGYNLVAHNLPSDPGDSKPKRRLRKKSTSRRKNPK